MLSLGLSFILLSSLFSSPPVLAAATEDSSVDQACSANNSTEELTQLIRAPSFDPPQAPVVVPSNRTLDRLCPRLIERQVTYTCNQNYDFWDTCQQRGGYICCREIITVPDLPGDCCLYVFCCLNGIKTCEPGGPCYSDERCCNDDCCGRDPVSGSGSSSGSDSGSGSKRKLSPGAIAGIVVGSVVGTVVAVAGIVGYCCGGHEWYHEWKLKPYRQKKRETETKVVMEPVDEKMDENAPPASPPASPPAAQPGPFAKLFGRS